MDFDAIVIGSGMSGGWAAKELCEKGFKTLVIERGRNVKHLEDYPTAFKNPWEFPHRGQLPEAVTSTNPVVSRCYAFEEATEHFFVKDTDHAYIQEKPFDWVRGYQVGGKSLLWARQVQRWSRYDFEGPKRDRYAVDWPLRYHELAPWYSHVEKFIGVNGNKDGLDTLPDGEFLRPWEMNAAEQTIRERIMAAFDDRKVVIGRNAHLTDPQEIHQQQGRGPCQARKLCERGCPYGGYFSSNSSTLPWAEKTGNLTLVTDTVVTSIVYDEERKKAVGVQVIDTTTGNTRLYTARTIFVNAATLNTNLILLNSKSNRFPNGLGNDNGLLGKYLAFHNYRGTASATFHENLDTYYYGRRPTAVMMPNFRNVYREDQAFKRGYMVFYTATRRSWGRQVEGPQFGAAYKDKLSQPGSWDVFMMMQGETIPIAQNHVRLSETELDQWGIPQLITSVGYTENDERMVQDFHQQARQMLEAAGCDNIVLNDTKQAPGLDIHEMGGVRMGHDPDTSLLNKYNQMHLCQNVFVTDGACMTSTSTQNPSLTFMALTARAVDYAAELLKKGEL
ncbi:MAG: GMC family oxidoreductase [Cyclobacteriaceae bacterium]|nr:GMC family oxidoreductase [Cyclobacteriaceae bacterium]